MKKKAVVFFLWLGSMLSAYLLLVIGTAILASLFGSTHPLAGSPVIVLTIFFGGPLSMLFIVPAFLLSLRLDAPTMKKAGVITLNGFGIVCSIATMLWSFMLWRTGPINLG